MTGWAVVLVGVVEGGLYWDVHWFADRGDSGFFGALSDVTGLTEVEARVVLDDVDAEEGLKVVGFYDGVSRLEGVAELLDGGLGRCGDSEVVDMKTKVDTFAVGIESVEKAGVVYGALVFV